MNRLQQLLGHERREQHDLQTHERGDFGLPVMHDFSSILEPSEGRGSCSRRPDRARRRAPRATAAMDHGKTPKETIDALLTFSHEEASALTDTIL